MYDRILDAIAAEIANLQHVRSVLTDPSPELPIKRGRGRPPKKALDLLPKDKSSKKRALTPEGQAAIAAAMKNRRAKKKEA